MKKWLIALFLLSVSIFAVQAGTPKFNAQEIEKYQKLYDEAVAKGNRWEQFRNYVKITAGKSSEVNSLADLRKFVVEAEAKTYGGDLKKDFLEKELIITAIDWYNRSNPNLAKEAFELAKTNGFPEQVIFYISSNRDLFTAEQRFDLYSEFMPRVSYYYQVKLAIDDCLRVLAQADEVKAKALLKKMNRAYSPMLITNKEQWEPIVAKVRTALETY